MFTTAVPSISPGTTLLPTTPAPITSGTGTLDFVEPNPLAGVYQDRMHGFGDMPRHSARDADDRCIFWCVRCPLT